MQANELISPDMERCVRCDACVDICPMHVILRDEDGYPQAVGKAFLTCINCGYCVDVCANGALRHRVRKRSVNPMAAHHAALKRLRAARERDKKEREKNARGGTK